MKPNVMYVKVEGRVYLDGRDLLSCLYSYLTQDAFGNTMVQPVESLSSSDKKKILDLVDKLDDKTVGFNPSNYTYDQDVARAGAYANYIADKLGIDQKEVEKVLDIKYGKLADDPNKHEAYKTVVRGGKKVRLPIVRRKKVSEDKVAVVKVLEDLVSKAYSKCDGEDCDGTYCVTHKESGT